METLEEIKKGNSAIVEIYQTYVIKKPKNTADTEIFIKTQMQAADVVNYVSGILKEKNLHINLPKTTVQERTVQGKTEKVIKESRMPGKKFDVATYNSLKPEIKEKLAKDLATFLIVMHGKTTPVPIITAQTDGSKKLWKGKDILEKDINRLFEKDEELKEATLQSKIDRILNVSEDKNVKKLIQDAINYIQNNNDDADNIQATRHHDLRDGNMFYDQKTNSLGIIDFEGTTKPGLVYEDFVGSPPSLSWDFEQKVIKYYNALSEQDGFGITINPEKIKNWLIYKTAWVAIGKNWKSEQVTEQLKEIGLFTSNKVKVFKNAIKKIHKKTNNVFVPGVYNSLEKNI